MASPDEAIQKVVIVGGGISGLSAAWYFQQETEEQSVHYTIVESSDRWGGKVRTERIGGYGDEPFVLDLGADAILTRKPWAIALARELGLEDRIQPVRRDNPRTFVLHHGKATPLPDGLALLAPTKLWPFLSSPLFSIPGKLRMGLDLVLPARRKKGDESLESFVTRRLGPEALDKLAEPLLGGVYNGEPERQSIAATFPQFPALEREHRSIILGTLVARGKQTAPDGPAFVSFPSGVEELVEALVPKLEGDLRISTAVTGVERLPGSSYRVTLSTGEVLEANAVIVATPAPIARELLKGAAPICSTVLDEFRTTRIGTAFFAYHRGDVPHLLNGYGVVIPRSEHRKIDGMTWTTSKWQHRAPEGMALIRVFFGGPNTREAIDVDDEALFAAVGGELRDILGITAEPVMRYVYRWPDGYPQYDIGHLDRVAAIERALPRGLFVTGSSYRGVGVPDCVKQGKDSASAAAAYLAGEEQPEPRNVRAG